jgi:hypothetical protein
MSIEHILLYASSGLLLKLLGWRDEILMFETWQVVDNLIFLGHQSIKVNYKFKTHGIILCCLLLLLGYRFPRIN